MGVLVVENLGGAGDIEKGDGGGEGKVKETEGRIEVVMLAITLAVEEEEIDTG